MRIEFVKLQGNGNDFILIDEMEAEVIPEDMKSKFAMLFCDRRFGIGGDGVLFLSQSDSEDVRMRIFQPDESEPEMCGNGIRCLVRYAFDREYITGECTVETGAGTIPVVLGYDENGEFSATIQMPIPAFTRGRIPATGDPDSEYSEEIGTYQVYAVNTGVPHAVVFVDEIGAIDPSILGPVIRNHPTLPEGANVNFVEKVQDRVLRIRTFERGVEGETFSCGTGATASAAVAQRLGYVGDDVLVETKGGPLRIRLGEIVTMSGPAEPVFIGMLQF
ncbi:MAG: diaminopimelate epimerase [Methanocalculus sp. MSAO_Arc2]|uniref:diaminopimelate epimerase n=1 Tax=Methanocalculus sp. MSAO_Arc2 TaxID=2293855 RepID=UPI000FF27008|nr:MAG: diaminopimelate epimerase [Methanocalculus sp. MSAO_Arc2]